MEFFKLSAANDARVTRLEERKPKGAQPRMRSATGSADAVFETQFARF